MNRVEMKGTEMWAVVSPDGTLPMFISLFKKDSMNEAAAAFQIVWEELESMGFTVQPVTVTVKGE